VLEIPECQKLLNRWQTGVGAIATAKAAKGFEQKENTTHQQKNRHNDRARKKKTQANSGG